jgi:glutamate--cysteine ligase
MSEQLLTTERVMEHSACDSVESTPLEHKRQLVEYLASGCKSPELFRLGLEEELFVYSGDDYAPADYDGSQPGIRSLLNSMMQFGWKPIHENGFPIGLHRRDCTISLEPGGQLEYSSAALRDVHQISVESRAYRDELATVASELGLHFLGMGHQPKLSRKELPWVPKERYRIMRDYMPKCGSQGLEMMQSTAAIQVTADFASESDMVKKFRVALALQPLVTALFANSPFAKGKFSGFLSYRSAIWRNTDAQRCGSLPFVFEKGMGFERYADYVLDVPMYFVYRDGIYIDASGLSFRDFMTGQLSVLPGQQPVLSDWVNHLTTVFPDVRLKKFLEMRGADAAGSISRVAALPALWAGLLYDDDSLNAAWDRVSTWTADERHALENGVAKHGFNTSFRGGTAQGLCLWMLDLSQQGLVRRDYRNQKDRNESHYLAPLFEAAQSGRTFAHELLHRFDHQWHRDIDTAVRAMCEGTLS